MPTPQNRDRPARILGAALATLLVAMLLEFPQPRGLHAQIPVRTAVGLESNLLELTWAAVPGGGYGVNTRTTVGGAWQPLNQDEVVPALNLGTFRTPPSNGIGFFQAVQLDRMPPQIYGTSPCDHGIAIKRTNVISVYLYDDLGLNTNSIRLTLGPGPAFTNPNPRLAVQGGAIRFAPLPGEILGQLGETLPVTLSVADRAGNQLDDFAWSFQLESAPVVKPNVRAVPGGLPGVTLISSNGLTWIYAFTGPASGIQPGMILVSADTNFLYHVTVLQVMDDPMLGEAAVVITNAPLAASFDQASLRFEDDFSGATLSGASPGGFLPAGQEPCCAANLDGRTLYSGPGLVANISTGRVSFVPHVGVGAAFNPAGLAAMDVEMGGELSLAVDFRATASAAGNYTNRVSLGSVREFFPLETPGGVLAYVEGELSFDLGFEGSWQAAGELSAGIFATNFLSIGAMLRSATWTPSATRERRIWAAMPNWAGDFTAQARVYVDVRLRVFLEGVPGPVLDLRQALEASGAHCQPPGFAGHDVFLHDALRGTLAVDARGWDGAAPVLAATNVLDVREPFFHTSQASRLGPGLQPIADMAWIPCGRFTMGRAATPAPPAVCDCPLTDVTFPTGFHIGRHEVTQGEYLGVISNNPSFFHGEIWGTNLSRPVEQVSWSDATNYCARLTARERAAGRIPADYAYRLPTEAEWEYACRAGTTTAFHYGDALRAGDANFDCALEPPPMQCLGNPAWGLTNPPQTTPVGLFAPNLWGVQDMHGNVREWCLDWLGNQLPGGVIAEPQGPSDATVRAVKGGSFLTSSIECASARRVPVLPTSSSRSTGFRVVLAPVGPGMESYTITLVRGYNLIANQIDRGSNTLAEVLPAVPNGCRFHKWVPALGGYVDDTFQNGWTNEFTLAPGEGGFLFLTNSPPTLPLTFYGTRRTMAVPLSIGPGLNMVSRQMPEVGTFESILLRIPQFGEIVYRYIPSSSDIGFGSFNAFEFQDPWMPSVPTANVGEAWFVLVF